MQQITLKSFGTLRRTCKNLFLDTKIYLSNRYPTWYKPNKGTLLKQGCRERGAGGGTSPLPSSHHFLEQNFFFHVKLENKIFTCQEHVDLSLFIEQEICDKKEKEIAEFWICCFISKLCYHSSQQQLCKNLFLITTFTKMNGI